MSIDFTKANQFNPNVDISFVKTIPENPEISALKSIGSSFFNNIILVFFKLITSTNLILLGHISREEKIHYQLFMTFQIGVFILEFLGKYFILGILKYILSGNKYNIELYNDYIRMKTALICITPLIIIPVSICSYYLIGVLFEYTLEIKDKSLIWEVFIKYLIFTPIIYFFEILFLLNLKFLSVVKRLKSIMYIISYLICHIVLSWILIFYFNFGLFGLTISYCLNSIIFFFFTDRLIFHVVKNDADNYFYLIPNQNNFVPQIFTLLKQLSVYSLYYLRDLFPNHFIFLASLFIDKNQLIVNIIYMNFFEVILEMNRGFYYTIKNDLFTKDKDTIQTQKILLFFSIYFSIISLTIIILLLLFKNILLDIYILHGGEPIMQKIAGSLKIIYSLSILFMSIKSILNGVVRGIGIAPSNKRQITYMIICITFCYFFCFLHDFGIFGLWLSLLILDILHVCENSFKSRYFTI